MTPHINATQDAFAPVVIMPGDPLRAQFIANNFLEQAKLVTNVRNMFGFTGFYKGQRISVMGSGMGIPSISIYAHELFMEYGVEIIIRAGSCGAIQQHIKVGDVIVAMGASTDSNVNRVRFSHHDFAAIADYNLLRLTEETAQHLNIPLSVGNIMTSDFFYRPDAKAFKLMEKMGILCVDMETAGLYGVAAECQRKALAVFTVSDHIFTKEATTSEERQTKLTAMTNLLLETAIKAS